MKFMHRHCLEPSAAYFVDSKAVQNEVIKNGI